MASDVETPGEASEASEASGCIGIEQCLSNADSPAAPPQTQETRETRETTAEGREAPLKQVYGMLCWLLVGGNTEAWRNDPQQACRTAIEQCPHLAGADAGQLKETMDRIGVERQRILDAHDGQADRVPRGVRLFGGGGPLFVIVDNA
ncbi:hypothetical protein H4R19_003813, partial [Coemansia spiralis]